MEKLIKLVMSPFNPNLEVVGDIVLMISVPYSDKDVTLRVATNVQDYQERADTPNGKVRQVMVTTSTSDTRTIKFDLSGNSTHKFELGGTTYEIKLMGIGQEKLENQNFRYYEFRVTSI